MPPSPWNDDDGHHDESYDDVDWDDDETSETTACSECGEAFYEDSPRCPHCGAYVTVDTNPWSGRSLFWILLGLAGIAAVIFALSIGR
jgi:uncharacterized paraquat-inducible protein A